MKFFTSHLSSPILQKAISLKGRELHMRIVRSKISLSDIAHSHSPAFFAFCQPMQRRLYYTFLPVMVKENQFKTPSIRLTAFSLQSPHPASPAKRGERGREADSTISPIGWFSLSVMSKKS
jgi:hypothetical protein